MNFKNYSTAVFTLFLLLSCSSIPSEKDDHSIEVKDESGTGVKSNKSENDKQSFKVLNISKSKFIVDSADRKNYVNYYHRDPELHQMFTIFTIDVDVKNETTNRITKFDAEGFIKVEFEDGSELRLPYYSGGMYFTDASKGKIWQPNSVHKLKFWYLGQDRDRRTLDLPTSKFERTPIQCDFIFNYKAISVDGEYTDELRYDILDDWKQFQKVLGLR